jgi:hypothetical protein
MSSTGNQQPFLVAVQQRTLSSLLRLTALKCAVGLAFVLYIGGAAGIPLAVPAAVCIFLVLKFWNRPKKAYPVALWLSSVFWASSSILILLDESFTVTSAFVFCAFLSIGVWDVIASRADVREI